MPYIPLKCDFQRFAPSVEAVTITYDQPLQGSYLSLDVEVYDYAGVLIYRQQYDCAEKLPELRWNGVINQKATDTEPFATPLRSPYTIKVLAEIEGVAPVRPNELSSVEAPPAEISTCPLLGQQEQAHVEDALPVVQPIADSVEIAVLYHSLEIVRGPWLATNEPIIENSNEGICDRLNKLGYHAGPPARVKADPAYLDKAKERFRRNCPMLRTVENPNNDNYHEALTAAALTPRPTLTDQANAEVAIGAVLPGADAPAMRIYLEAIGFQAPPGSLDEFNAQYITQKNTTPTNKAVQDAARLNRPLIPLETVIYLQDHSGARVLAPSAVGPVRVDWRINEPVEDTSTLPFAEAMAGGTRTYIRRLMRSLPSANPQQTNCLDRYGGIRTIANNHRNPFWLEAQPYAPYAVPVVDDNALAVHVPANTDPAHAARVGRSGLYLHPSIIAGDRYQVTAELSFAGLPNALPLATASPDKHYQTAPMVVWRRTEVLAIVGWPTTDLGDLATQVKREYAHAYVELDFSATAYPVINDVLDHQAYTQWLEHIAKSWSKSPLPMIAKEIDTTHLPAHPIHLLQPLGELKQAPNIAMLVDRMFSELRFKQSEPGPAEFLTNLLSAKLRLKHPAGGLLFLNYRQHQEVARLCQNEYGQIPTLSNGNNDLAGIIDQAVPGKPWYIFAHEFGHCFWLRHHENAPDSEKAKTDHDQFDHNCIMSYTQQAPSPERRHQTPASYSPSFCGKCNLKLRGWNILHQDITRHDQAAQNSALTTLFCHDAADSGLKVDQERQNVEDAITEVSRGPFNVLPFAGNALFDAWMQELGNCDIYHHVSHGNTRCQYHKRRAPTLELLTPRYPICCAVDAERSKRLINSEREKISNCSPTELESWASKELIQPDEWWHKLRSVIQWTVNIDDSSQDIEFTYDQIEKAINNKQKTPRLLAFFSSCLLGWDSGLAKLFIDAGTPFVIAFRSRYETAQALQFSKIFYREWSKRQLTREGLMPAFIHAAREHPHAEPVLFSSSQVIRAYAKDMKNGSGEMDFLTWGQTKEFAAPHFPKR